MVETFELSLYRDIIGMKFDELEAYANSLENYLSNEVKVLEARLKIQTATMSEEQKDAIYDYASDDFIHLTESFPQTLRTSLFVHCYSLFEHSLNELAYKMGKLRGIKITPKDLRDDGIMRSKTFLKDVVLIAFPDTHSSWSGITTLNKIRNYFVHREGYLPDGDNKQVEKFVTSPNSGLRLAEEPGSKRIVIASEVFNQNVLKSFETFNDVLLKTLLADAKARIV